MYSSLYVSQQIVPLGGTKLPHLVAPYAAPPITPPSLQSIEWDMLLFFCGMFIMVEGAVELGLMRKIAAFITFIIDTAPVSAQKV